MLKDFLKYWLDLDQQDRKLNDLEAEIEQLQNEFATEKEVDQIRARVRDLEPLTVDLTDREREVLQVFLEKDEWLNTSMIASEINTSTNNASSIMSNLKRKVEFESRSGQHNQMKYRLPKEEERRIFNSGRS